MRAKILFSVVAFSFSFAPFAFGIITQPPSKATVSPDGKHLFVELSFRKNWDRNLEPFELPDGRRIVLRDQFEFDGVYDVETLDLVWKWEAPNPGYTIEWNEDFSSIAFVHSLDFKQQNDDLLLFFVNKGKLIKTYTQGELLSGLRNHRWFMHNSIWPPHWCEDFEKVDSRIVLSTVERKSYFLGKWLEPGLQEFYEFDLVTGEMISRRIENKKLIAIIVYMAGLIILIVAIVFIWIQKRKRARLRAGHSVRR